MGKSLLAPRDPWASYRRIIEVPTYQWVLLRTLLFSAGTAAICLVLGYPVAYQMTRVGPLARTVILVCIFVPFWTNLLVRTYGWIIILNPKGVINSLLIEAGLISTPLELVYNTMGVLIGLSQVMLPYMILPLYAVMTRLDPRITHAARSLGATPLASFLKVYLPLTMPGVMAGILLVFTISLGFFIVPALLGGPRGLMLAQLIEFNINETLNWPMASALSTCLLAVTLALYWIGDRWFHLGSIWGVQK
jgi:putative spermidine/putrescine transport system permease protein